MAGIEDMQTAGDACRDKVLTKMNDISALANKLEALIPDSFLPYPTYEKLLFAI